LTTNTGAENEVLHSDTTAVEMYWRRTAYMPIIDSVISNQNTDFLKKA